MIRSFLAIELPRTVVKEIQEVQNDLRASEADVRWVNPAQIHLTLKFFGNIEESQVEPIVTSLEEPARETPSFLVNVRGVGAFPHLKNPRVIWMGVVDEEDVLCPFQKRLEESMEPLGFRPEARRFHPHLTLGRVRSARGRDNLVNRIQQYREKKFGAFKAEKVLLFKSELKPSGAVYTILKEVMLRTSIREEASGVI